MRLNWKCMRTILEAIESAPPRYAVRPEALTVLDCDVANYHLHILAQAGFITGKTHVMNDGSTYTVATGLTFDGHELLGRLRSPEVWKRVGEMAIERGIELTLDTARALAPQIVKSLIGS